VRTADLTLSLSLKLCSLSGNSSDLPLVILITCHALITDLLLVIIMPLMADRRSTASSRLSFQYFAHSASIFRNSALYPCPVQMMWMKQTRCHIVGIPMVSIIYNSSSIEVASFCKTAQIFNMSPVQVIYDSGLG